MSDATAMQKSLEDMGFDKSYIKRAIKRNYPDRALNMELIIEIISRLEAKDASSGGKKRKKKSSAAAEPARPDEGAAPAAAFSAVALDAPPPAFGGSEMSDISSMDRQSSMPESIGSSGEVFQPGDLVYYKSPDAGSKIVKAEVTKVTGYVQVEISYPLSASLFERRRAIVNARLIQKIPDKSRRSESVASGAAGFDPYLTRDEVSRLNVGDHIDHRDEVGRYVNAEIIERKGKMVKIHYIGWSRKWDCFSDLERESNRFCRSESVSKRPAHRFTSLKKGDFVDICPKLRHHGVWLAAEIRRLDKKSGQVQVVYEKDSKNYLYWAHLDDESEIEEFTKLSGTSQTAQMEVFDEIKAKEERKAAKLRRKEERKRLREQKKERKKQLWQHKSDKDQRETLRKLREKRFPLLTPDEVISNPFTTGDWLEVQDAKTGRWILAIVMDSCNNWIVVHYDGFSAKYDQRVHVIEMKDRLRRLGSALEESDVELEIRQEAEDYQKGITALSKSTGDVFKLVEIGADGNCLYRSFAHEIYGNQDDHKQSRVDSIKYMVDNKPFFCNFIFDDWDETIKSKSQEFEWGDHIDITALSEYYNVRVKVYELDKTTKTLFCSIELGDAADPTGEILPCIYLARRREKHYDILEVTSELVRKPRPLGTAEERAAFEPQESTIRQLRVNEELKYAGPSSSSTTKLTDADGAGGSAMAADLADDEEEDESSEVEDEDEKALRNVQFSLIDVGQVLAKAEVRPPLTTESLKKVFPYAARHMLGLYKNVWEETPMFSLLDVSILERFYDGLYGEDSIDAQSAKFIQRLQSKVGSASKEFGLELFRSSFNRNVCKQFGSSLAPVVMSQLEFGTPGGLETPRGDGSAAAY